MKHIGVVGISSEGAALCYRTICTEAHRRLGEYRQPQITLHHFSLHEILKYQNKNNWPGVADVVLRSIKHLQQSGADFVIIPANSTHFSIEEIQKESLLPVLNLLDIVADECTQKGYKKVGLLGVGITMKDRLFEKALSCRGIEMVIPDEFDCRLLNDLIYNELVADKITERANTRIVTIIQSLKSKGCEAVILGCTELPLVINASNSPLPVIDTTKLLAIKALEFAIS